MATIIGTSGNDNLPGLTDPSTIGNDSIYALAGNDTINGGVGIDTMEGGDGDDIYYVDNADDVIIEGVDAGIDTVYSYVSYNLSSNLENLYFLGSASFGSGNALNNYIMGNSENNYLNGLDGNDTMIGGLGSDGLNGDGGNDMIAGGDGNNHLNGDAGDDMMTSGDGHDELDGGAGIDTMIGGLGTDVYYVDSADDVIIEGVDANIDARDGVQLTEFYTSNSYTLSANLENLQLHGSASYGYGNALDNSISGNLYSVTNEYLWGGAGNDMLSNGVSDTTSSDTMVGGDGDDLYITNSTSDVIIEDVDAGIDSVYASNHTLGTNLENLYINGFDNGSYGYGNALNNYIAGDHYTNTLKGGAGNDSITGLVRDNNYVVEDSGDFEKTRSDVLTGGTGADYFIFHSYDANYVYGIDTITDFRRAEGDKIALSASGLGDLISTSGVIPGSLHPSHFVIGSTAADSSDRIIYNSSTGALFFDPDGTGAVAQGQIATLCPNLGLISSDFQVIA